MALPPCGVDAGLPFPVLVALAYLAGAPDSIGTPQRLVLTVVAMAMLSGILLLWRGVMPRPPPVSFPSARSGRCCRSLASRRCRTLGRARRALRGATRGRTGWA